MIPVWTGALKGYGLEVLSSTATAPPLGAELFVNVQATKYGIPLLFWMRTAPPPRLPADACSKKQVVRRC